VVGEDVPTHRLCVGPQALPEARPVEDVVAEHQCHGLVPDEVRADHEGLCQAFGPGLDGVLDPDADRGPVAEETLEAGLVLGGGDDEDLADTGIHQQ
jgi:hypothetical protein